VTTALAGGERSNRLRSELLFCGEKEKEKKRKQG
tara:strand:+ start:1002 stop:1103 length:102 start_codon:yes stop_codon:yes gene_type:complete